LILTWLIAVFGGALSLTVKAALLKKAEPIKHCPIEQLVPAGQTPPETQVASSVQAVHRTTSPASKT
jgi:hypothetical protein